MSISLYRSILKASNSVRVICSFFLITKPRFSNAQNVPKEGFRNERRVSFSFGLYTSLWISSCNYCIPTQVFITCRIRENWIPASARMTLLWICGQFCGCMHAFPNQSSSTYHSYHSLLSPSLVMHNVHKEGFRNERRSVFFHQLEYALINRSAGMNI